MQLLQYQLCYWTFFKKRISQKNLSKRISFSWPHTQSTLADSFSSSQQASRPTRWLCILQNTNTKIVSLHWSPCSFLQLFCNACIRLYQPSGVSTGRDKDKRFRTVDNSQMDSQFEHNLTIFLCQLLLFGAPHVSMAGLRKRIHPFLLLKMLLSFALVSLRYVQSVSVVVVTISKLDFE